MVYYSELAYLNHPTQDLLKEFIAHGTDKIEFMLDGMYWEENFKNWDKTVKMLKQAELFYSIHPVAWDMNLTSESSDIQKVTYNHYVDCIRFAHDIEADQVVIHPGFTAPPFSRDDAQNRADHYLHLLADVAKPLGVKLALENVGTTKTMIYSQDEFANLANSFDDHVGLLIDIGHAQITKFDIPKLISQTKDKLFSVHIHDNSGMSDDHLPIGEGSINYDAIFKELKKCPNCHLVLEYYSGVDLSKLERDKKLLENM